MIVHAIVAGLWLLTSPGVQAPAQAPAGPTGHWEGAIQVPGQELQIAVDLADRGGKWEGAISIPTQGLKGFPLSGITVVGTAVNFAMKGVPGDPQFKGTLSKDGKTLAGDFSQGGGNTTFSLAWKGEAKFETPAKSTAITKDFEGSWEGTVTVTTTPLRLVLKLATQDGVATGTLISVDQGGAEIPITTVTQKGSHLNLVISLVSGNYDGDLKDGQIVGTWTQGPMTAPLTFKRAAK